MAGISAFAASRNSKLLVVMVAGSIASLKVAVTAIATPTPVAPLTGNVAVTVGDVMSLT